MSRYGIIYKITNKANGKIYIGQTIFSFKERYWGNLYKYTKNQYLKREIAKYGIENFEVIEEFDSAGTKEELDKLEKEYITLYHSNDPKHGYNYLSGGHNGKHNAISKQKISDAQKGELNHMYGKHGKNSPKYSRVPMKCDFCGADIEVLNCYVSRSKHHYCSNECRQNDISNCNKGTRNSKIIVTCEYCGKQFEKFPSQTKNKKHIFCSIECKNAGNSKFYSGVNNPNYANSKGVSGSKNGRAKKVLNITTGEIFGCARDAEKKYCIHCGGVASCCRGEQKSSGGFKWEYSQ